MSRMEDGYNATDTVPGNTAVVAGVGTFLALFWGVVGAAFVRIANKNSLRREVDDARALAAELNGAIGTARHAGVSVKRAIAWACLFYEIPSFSSFAFTSPQLWGDDSNDGFAEFAERLLTLGIDLQNIYSATFGFFMSVHCLMAGAHVVAAICPSCPNMLNSKLVHYAAPVLYDLLLFPCYQCFFHAMICDVDESDGRWYLRRDSSFDCWSDEHTQSALYALVAVSLLYPSSLLYAVKQKNDRNPAIRLIAVFNVLHTMEKCLLCATFSCFRHHAFYSVPVLVVSLSCHWFTNYALVPCKGRGRIVNNFRSASLACSLWAGVCAWICVMLPAVNWATMWLVCLYVSALPLFAVGAWRFNNKRSSMLSLPTAPLKELLKSKTQYTRFIATEACGMLTNVSRACRQENVLRLEKNLREQRQNNSNDYQEKEMNTTFCENGGEGEAYPEKEMGGEGEAFAGIPGENGDDSAELFAFETPYQSVWSSVRRSGAVATSRFRPRSALRSGFDAKSLRSRVLSGTSSSGRTPNRRELRLQRNLRRREKQQACRQWQFATLSAKSIVLMMWSATQTDAVERLNTRLFLPKNPSSSRFIIFKKKLAVSARRTSTVSSVPRTSSFVPRTSSFAQGFKRVYAQVRPNSPGPANVLRGSDTAVSNLRYSQDEEHALKGSLSALRAAVWLCWPGVAKLAASVLVSRCVRLVDGADLLSTEMRVIMLGIFSVSDECRVAVVTLTDLGQKHLWVGMSSFLAGIAAADEKIADHLTAWDMLKLVHVLRRCEHRCDPRFVIRANLLGVAQRFVLHAPVAVATGLCKTLLATVLPFVASRYPWVQKYSEDIARQCIHLNCDHDQCGEIGERLKTLDGARVKMRTLVQRLAWHRRELADLDPFARETRAVLHLIGKFDAAPGTGGDNPMLAFLTRSLMAEALVSSTLVIQPSLPGETTVELFGKRGHKLTEMERNRMCVQVLNILNSGFLS